MREKEKTEVTQRIIPLPAQEVGISEYPYDLKEELEFVKTIGFDDQSTPEDPRIKTSLDKFILFRPELKRLYKWCQERVDDYVKNVLYSSVKIKINSSWVAMQVSGSRTEPHVHVSIIDGCFYLNVPDDKTPLMLDTYNSLGVREDFEVPIKTKSLVLWDNVLSHWVPVNNNKETRYSLAFNTSLEEQFNLSLALGDAEKNISYPKNEINHIEGLTPGENTDTIIRYIHTNNLRKARNEINKRK